MAKITGDISPKHENDFLLIKGFFASKSVGDALEKMIDRVTPEIKKELIKNKKG